MAIPFKPQTLTNVIAHIGDKITVTDNLPLSEGQPTIAFGWPKITSLPVIKGGVSPSREGFNGLFNLLSQHIFYNQSGMLYSWDESLSYPAGAIIQTDNNIYIAAADNGPDYESIGTKNPATETDYWIPLIIDNSVTLTAGGTGAKNAAEARINLGLGNVDNTHDIDKPISTATQNALNGKQPTGDYATNTVLNNHTGNKANPHNVTKAQVGLGNCDNTSDMAKPISTATQNALNGKQPTGDYATNTALNNGLAGKANTNHNHIAAQVTFTDGLTFQQKLDNGSLKGPQGIQGPQGAKGNTGAQGPAGTTYFGGMSGVCPIYKGGTGQSSINNFVKIQYAGNAYIYAPSGGRWYCLVFSAGSPGIIGGTYEVNGGDVIPNSYAPLNMSYAICFRIL